MCVTLCDALYVPLFKDCVTEVHEQLELKSHTILQYTSDVASDPSCFYPGKSRQYPLGRRLGTPQVPYGHSREEKYYSVQYSLSIIQTIYRVHLFNFTMLSVCQSVLRPMAGGPVNGG